MTLADRAGRLAAPPTRLIGRERELGALRELLLRDDVRLVTVTGAAGIGKTRLALAAAACVADRFADGAVFVDLSAIADPGGVFPAIGRTLGLAEVSPLSTPERIRDYLRDQSALLALDNFEQVLAAATDLAGLLAASARLKLLVTSRAALRIRWEHVFETPPLDVPDLASLPAPADLAGVPAVALFLDRARAAGSDLRLDAGNAREVAELCARLDGLPLALELAATQTRFMSPGAMLARLDHRLDLLTRGARDHPERQRTLREAIGWSHRLLSDDERAVFRRLGVFVGGVSLDAARAVASVDGDEAGFLAILAALVDQNLLRREVRPDGEPRFRMLESIREFARERLIEAGELESTRRRFAAYWCDLAESAEVELRRPAQVAWLDRLEREWPNLGAALAWCERAGEIEPGVRLAAALGWFWYLRGGTRWEGRRWLERFAGLAASIPEAASARARALSAAGLLAQYQLDLDGAFTYQEKALALGRAIPNPAIVALALGRLAHLCLFRTELERGDELAAASYEQCCALDDRWGMAFALGTRGLIARTAGRLDDATRYLGASLDAFRSVGDAWGIAHVLLGLGHVALHQGDLAGAERYWEERLRRSRELDNETGVGHTLDLLATVARRRGDLPRAAARFEEALAIKRKIGDRQALAWVLQGMGELALARGDRAAAFDRLRECLELRREIAEPAGIVASLLAFARLAAALQRPRRAAHLAGAADALYHAIGPTRAAQHYSQAVLPTALARDDPEIERARRRLGRAQWQAAWDEGAAMSAEQAIAEGLALEAAVRGAAGEPGSLQSAAPPAVPAVGADVDPEPRPSDLTRREREVAALLARGYTNRQIATALVITEGTAHLHVVRLLNKLGFHRRSQVAVWASAHGLSSGSG